MTNNGDSDADAPRRQLQRARRRRLWLLGGVTLLCAIGAGAAAAYFGFVIVGGGDAEMAFGVGLAFTAGPAVLLTVLAYLRLVQSPLREQFAAHFVVPLWRCRLDGFNYDSAQGLDVRTWVETGFFDEELVREASTSHLVTGHIDGLELRFCRFQTTSRPEWASSAATAAPRGFDGLLCIAGPEASGAVPPVDDHELHKRIRTSHPDAPPFDVSTDDSTLRLAIFCPYPTPDPRPWRPVVDDKALRRWGDCIDLAVDAVQTLSPE